MPGEMSAAESMRGGKAEILRIPGIDIAFNL